MKGILKIYHPEETLTYHIEKSYCKAVYHNTQHFLEVEITTNDSLDLVDDDSLQYHFPQLSLSISDFPIKNEKIAGNTFHIEDNDEEQYTEVNLFDDEDAYTYQNELSFENNDNGELQLTWKGEIDDFYTETDEPIAFKLKCHFRPDELNIEDE